MSSDRILHWNGVDWRPQHTGYATTYAGISILDDRAVIAIDAAGTVFRSRGA